jgi:hypothetical protein
MAVLPSLSVAVRLTLPLVSVTVPVGAVEPDAPATVTATDSGCSVLIPEADGVTATAGVKTVTSTEAVPEVLL